MEAPPAFPSASIFCSPQSCKTTQKGEIPTFSNRIGVSSACFYPDEALDAIKHSIDLGFKNLEIFLNTFSELEMPHLNAVNELCRERGVRVVSVHPFTSGFEYMLFFSAHKKRALESAEMYRKYFHAAAVLGAEYTVFHGDSATSPFFGMDNYCEVLANIMRVAKEEGVTLIHENVSTARAGDPAFMRELHEHFGKGNIKFVFDLKQTARGGYDAMSMLRAMGDDIVHVHINDWLDGEFRLPYAGELDLDTVISTIEQTGYNGKYIIEVYRHNFREDSEISESAAKLSHRLM